MNREELAIAGKFIILLEKKMENIRLDVIQETFLLDQIKRGKRFELQFLFSIADCYQQLSTYLILSGFPKNKVIEAFGSPCANMDVLRAKLQLEKSMVQADSENLDSTFILPVHPEVQAALETFHSNGSVPTSRRGQ